MAGRRVFGGQRFATFDVAGVVFGPAAEAGFGADRRRNRKMNLLPKAPLLGELSRR